MKYIFFSFLFFSILSYANYELPRNLDTVAQETVAKTFGFASSAKMSIDPRPLGGYDGFQLSVSRDYVNVSSIKGLGTGGSADSYFSSSSIMIGKGLFYDFDMFIQMTPPQNNDFSSYGGIFRRKIYTVSRFPLNIGLLIHGSLSQFTNYFGSNIVGYDIYAYSEMQKIIFFAGLGQARGIHTFAGGASALTADSAHEATHIDLSTSHVWGGASYLYGRWMVSAVAEQYFDLTYSLKFAYNF